MSAQENHYTHWLEERLQHWQHLHSLSQGGRRDKNLAQTREVLDGYRALAADLALARQHAPGSMVHRALESLYLEVHTNLQRTPLQPLAQLWDLFAIQVPAATRSLRADIWLAGGLFILATLLGGVITLIWSDIAGLFLSDTMLLMVQNRTLWTDNLLNVMPSSLLSYQLMSNNITVALTAFALGCLFGLGTLYVVILNGLLLGCAFGYTYQYDMALRLFEFVIAHGLVELAVICLAAAAGLTMGRSLARPGAQGRMASLQASAKHAGALAALSVPCLIGSGFIEGYISPNDGISLEVKTTVGVVWFMFLIAIMHGRLLELMHQTWLRARSRW